MTALRLPLVYSPSDESYVQVDAYEAFVKLDIRECDERMALSLAPEEARALAAILLHQAAEAS